MSAFTKQLRYEAFVNNYQDGSSDRAALTANARNSFQMTKRMTTSEWSSLRAFYNAHIGIPFYFYVPRETIPPFTPDPTGAATDGRYTVVFDGAWSETTGIGRSVAQLSLREVV